MASVYVVTTVPDGHVEAVLDAIASVGGGVIGEYTHCAFTNIGKGRFRPSDVANPHTGVRGEINAVEEWRVETFCERGIARRVVQAIRTAHPYEEPVIYIMPLLDEAEL